MKLNADITLSNDFLHVHLTGAFSLEEANEITTRIFQNLIQHSVQKVLVDFRKVIG